MAKSYINSIQDVQGLTQTVWDAIVVGTGMGGGTLGYALAEGGQKVLFLEKGEDYFDNPRALRGDYTEVLVKKHFVGGTQEEIALNSGRWYGEIYDEVNKRFVRPILGNGSGGSSALYGMTLERFFPSDFEPRRYHQQDTESTLPDRWPVSYEEMVPFYERAEELYRLHSHPILVDPYRDGANSKNLKIIVPYHIASRIFEWIIRRKGMRTYMPATACEWKLNCHYCRNILCDKDCKNDAARICLRPAVEKFGATLLTRFAVTHLDADRGQVTGVRGLWRGEYAFSFKARRVFLAAGALATPLLLLRSRSGLWPQGLANGSGAVGRNLMRHLIDFYFLPSIWDFSKSSTAAKDIAFNNFYEVDGVKYGAFHPLERFPPALIVMQNLSLKKRQASIRAASLFSFFSPLTTFFVNKFLTHSGCGVPIMEDLPQWNNRVEEMARGPDGRERIAVNYRISEYDQTRLKTFRGMLGKLFVPYLFFRLPVSQSLQFMGNVCGTVRFGNDSSTSVLNGLNRCHEVENLYVVDSSFFPSSGGTYPALTIAANALRVAEHVLRNAH